MSTAMPTREAPARPAHGAWHARTLPEVLSASGAAEHGLSQAEVAVRLREHGPNRLPHRPPPAWWEIALRQFRSPLIYILVIAAAASLAIDEVIDAAFILAVLALNAVIGGFQEWRAERSSHALQQLLRIRAAVVRDGEVQEIDAEEVVRGDVVWLESGNRVPADIRLLAAQGLEVDESLLSGESLPVGKEPSWEGRRTRRWATAATWPTPARSSRAAAATWTWRGDPTDVALLSLAAKLDRQREATLELHPQVNQIPFEPERCYAASFHRDGDGVRSFVKGAPERVLGMCDADGESLQFWRAEAEAMARQGYRVLALEPGEGGELRRRPRPPHEPIFNRLMLERVLVAAVVMSGVGLLGTLAAQGIHLLAMYLPVGHAVLRTEPVSLLTWLSLLGLALTVFVAMEIHKWTWRRRYPPEAPARL